MRLCAALSVVLVASLVLAFEVMRRPKHHAPQTIMSEGVEAPRSAPPRAPFRSPPTRPRQPAREPVRGFSPPAPEPERTATIAGRLRVVDGGRIYVVVTASDNPEAAAMGFAGEDAFSVQGLMPGRRYDIQFSSDRIRTLRLTGIEAPATDLDITLEARAVIHVAVGFPRGETCPIETLTIHRRHNGADDPEDVDVADRSDCRFQLHGPEGAGPVTIEAAGSGERFTATVDVPAHGDPEPICLNPPCRANPLEGQAQLRVVLDGVDARSSIHATIVAIGDKSTAYGCVSSRFTCSIAALPAGLTYTLTASGRDCHGGPVTVTTIEGENQVSVPCRRDPPEIEAASDSNDDNDIDIETIEITSDSSDDADT